MDINAAPGKIWLVIALLSLSAHQLVITIVVVQNFGDYLSQVMGSKETSNQSEMTKKASICILASLVGMTIGIAGFVISNMLS